MKIKEIYLKSVNDFFENEGFKLKKSENSFEKNNGNGCLFKFKCLFHKRSYETAIEILINIIHSETEKIYRKVTKFDTEGTIGNQLFTIINNPDGEMKSHYKEKDVFTVSNEDEMIEAVKLTKKYFFEVANPYYLKYGSLESIDKILNEDIDKMSVHCVPWRFRGPKGIIVAKLVKRSNYDELVKVYSKKMEKTNPEDKKRFRLIVDYLAKME